MFVIIRSFMVFIMSGCLPAGSSYGDCETTTQKSLCVERSIDDLAQQYLNQGEFDEVIQILKPLVCVGLDELENCISFATSDYFRHVRLASAFAGKGQYDVNTILEKMVIEEKSIAEALGGEQEVDLSDQAQRANFAERMRYIVKALTLLEDVFLFNQRPESSDLNASKYLVSGQFQESVFSAIKILNCESIFNFVSADLLNRSGILDDFPMCSFTAITADLDSVIKNLPEFFGDCESCSEAAAQFEEQQEVFDEVLAELGDDVSDENATQELLIDKCIEQGNAEEACRSS